MIEFPSIPMTTEEAIEFDKWLEEYKKQIRADTIEECREIVNEILRYYRNEYHFGVTFNCMCNWINEKIEQMQKGVENDSI